MPMTESTADCPKPDEAEEKTASGIYLPEGAKEKPLTGKIVAAGPGALNDDGKRTALTVKKGDTVIYGKYGGTEVDIDGSPGLSAIDMNEYVVFFRANGCTDFCQRQTKPGDIRYVSECNDFRVVTDGVHKQIDDFIDRPGVRRDGESANGRACPGSLHVPGNHVRRVILVPHDDFVACL